MKRKKRSSLKHLGSEYIHPSKYLIREVLLDDESMKESNQSSPIPSVLGSDSKHDDNSSSHPLTLPNHPIHPNPHKQEEQQHRIFLIDRIGTDCLELIFSFLTYPEMAPILFVSRQWSRVMVPLFYTETYDVLASNEHLEELKEEGRNYDTDTEFGYEGLYTESATWKPTLCYDTEDELDAEREELLPPTSEDSSEENDDDLNTTSSENLLQLEKQNHDHSNSHLKNSSNLQNYVCDKRLPFGSPLCKHTIQDQFYLVQDSLSKDEYIELVEQYLKVNMRGTMNQDNDKLQPSAPFYINPFLFYDQIEHEQSQIKPYMWEITESIRRDGYGPIIVGNFSGHTIYNDDEYYESYQASDLGFVFYALRGGIARLMRRAGVKYYEPQMIEDALYILKDFIRKVLQQAYETKFQDRLNATADCDNKDSDSTQSPIPPLQFTESDSQYHERWYPDPEYKGPYCNDDLDSDLKLNHHDIVDAVEKVLKGYKLFYAPESDPYNLGNYNEFKIDETTIPIKKSDDESFEKKPNYILNSEIHHSESNIQKLEENNEKEDIDSDDEEELTDDSDFDELTDDEEVVDNTNTTIDMNHLQYKNLNDFIDDSELAMDIQGESVHEGDSLRDRLIKVSMQVHEEIYEYEKTHAEKLYLKNWYGNGNVFFTHAAKHLGDDNPELLMMEDEDEEIMTSENALIEKDRKEDVAYFGYSLFDDDENEFPIFCYTHNNETNHNKEGHIIKEQSDHTIDDNQADEETSKEYHLRRLLRERSFQCIEAYFSESH
nr:unnamed protein product [Naegleria fowleri]